MNTLSNGAIAVGTEGSWMRFQSAYEFELEKMYQKGILRLVGMETIPQRAEKMLVGLLENRAIASDSMKAAAKACGVKATERAIVDYLKATHYDPRIVQR